MNLVVGTHIEVGGIVARQHHWRISAQELHLAVVAGHGHLGGFRRLDGDIGKLGIGNLACCGSLPFQEIGFTGFDDMGGLEVKCNHASFDIVARRNSIVNLVSYIQFVKDSTVQRC